jgi:hypothetical protein
MRSRQERDELLSTEHADEQMRADDAEQQQSGEVMTAPSS